METREVISLSPSLVSYQEALHTIIKLAGKRESSFVCFANVHMTVEAYLKPNFKSLLNRARLITADGMPLAKSLNYLYGIHQERIVGMDMMQDVLAACEKDNLSVYLFGSTDRLLNILQIKIKQRHPDLKIAGAYSPPFGKFNQESNNLYCQHINESGADLVLVCLGCPKQETWMAENYACVNAVMLGVGGAFEVYAGLKKRAPRWMQNLSLEWLYRLGQDPARLMKRYVITNSIFVFLLVKQLLLMRLPRKSH